MDLRAQLLKFTAAYKLEQTPSVEVFERKKSVKQERATPPKRKRRYTRRRISTPL
jgi:hypothetical protein